MTWSLNEVEALARKSARGAGMSWGMAEETGKSVRWLCATGLPGAEALAGLLALQDGIDFAGLSPDCDGSEWQARDGSLCPILTGAALCDRADELAGGHAVTLGQTSYPLLLVPFVASASDMTGAALRISWPGFAMSRAGRETRITGEDAACRIAALEGVVVGRADALDAPRLRRSYRGDIPSDVATRLGNLAHRTYAPDTPESRLAGAGAGLTDND